MSVKNEKESEKRFSVDQGVVVNFNQVTREVISKYKNSISQIKTSNLATFKIEKLINDSLPEFDHTQKA